MEPVVVMNGAIGLNNNSDPFRLQPSQGGSVWLSSCMNVVVADDGRVIRCLGKDKISDSKVHSLFSYEQNLCHAEDGVLYTPAGEIPLSNNNAVSYAKIQNRVIFSNGTDIGYFDLNGYSLDIQGTYTGPASPRDFILHPIPGIVHYGIGRLFVIDKNVVWYSEEHNPYVFCLSDNRFQFNSDVRMLAFFEDSFWVSDCEAIYFVQYRNGMWIRNKKASYAAYKGKPAYINIAELPLENLFGVGYICPTEEGICLLGQDGIFINLTHSFLEFKNSTGEKLKLQDFVGVVRNNKYYISITGEQTLGLIFNLKNLAVTQHNIYNANSFCLVYNDWYGAFDDGLYKVFLQWPRVDSHFTFNFNTVRTSRLRNLRFHGEFYGDGECDVISDETIKRTYVVDTRKDGMVQHELRVPIQRDNGIGTYWTVKFKNKNGRMFAVNKAEVTPIYNRRIY